VPPLGLQVLDNLTYVRVFTSEQQLQVLQEAAALLTQDQFRLIIVDSSTVRSPAVDVYPRRYDGRARRPQALFRVDYQGRGELAIRQQMLGKARNDTQPLQIALAMSPARAFFWRMVQVCRCR
jgi:RecA/RadA recombinase